MPDVLIVGAGPAGIAAALELKKLGVKEIVVAERESEAGGIPRMCGHIGFGLRDMHRVMTGPPMRANIGKWQSSRDQDSKQIQRLLAGTLLWKDGNAAHLIFTSLVALEQSKRNRFCWQQVCA